ncbi:MAG: FAD-dependent oxidoreductase, partial [Flavobacteriales bacterium]|nr:FAD-dependent oxidoreductase [Flavobacteriales bacterium]
MRNQGFDVVVHEKNDFVGGKLSDFRLGEFRFDFGPSLFSFPKYLEDLFESCNRSLDDYLEYQKQEVSCQYFWSDGVSFKHYNDSKDLEGELHKIEVSKREYQTYASKVMNMSNDFGDLFIENKWFKSSFWLRSSTIKKIIRMPLRVLVNTLNDFSERHFKSKKMIQLMNRYATFNGSDPFRISGLFSVIGN